MLDQEKKVRYWVSQQDVTDRIYKHASEFIKFYPDDASLIAPDKTSFVENIDGLIERLSLEDSVDPEVRVYTSRLLSYIYRFFCENFNGKCYGNFNEKNAGAAFYALRICINKKIYNLSNPFNNALLDGASFSQFVFDFEK